MTYQDLSAQGSHHSLLSHHVNTSVPAWKQRHPRRIYQAAALPDPPLPCEEILAASA